MLKKCLYVLLLLALVSAAAYAFFKSAGSEKEMQKLRAQMYDLQKQVEKQNVSKQEEAPAPVVAVKEEREISEAVLAPSKTPPSVVHPAKVETPIVTASDSNDFAQSLADIQEEVKAQALKETALDESAEEAADDRAIDMSEVDAMIKEAEEKLVAQYGSEILKKEEKEEKIAEVKVSEQIEEVKTETQSFVETVSTAEEELPGSVPVVSIDEDVSRRLDNLPRQIETTYSSARSEITPVHSDTVTISSVGTSEPAPVQRSTSLRPASEVIVPLKARQEVERDIRREEALRRPPERVQRISKKNYNALGNKTMADVMKEGL